MTPSLTVALTLAYLTVLLTALSLKVSQLRLRHRVSFGDGGKSDLLAAMRAHGNTLEQSMLFGLLAVAHVALAAGMPRLLMLACASFALARAVHVLGLFGRRLRWRQAAHAVSVLCQLALALSLAVGATGRAVA